MSDASAPPHEIRGSHGLPRERSLLVANTRQPARPIALVLLEWLQRAKHQREVPGGRGKSDAAVPASFHRPFSHLVGIYNALSARGAEQPIECRRYCTK